jgi:hypothetical protein
MALTDSFVYPFCRAGKDCVTRLLDKDERTRLGSRSGASEVKQHKWFAKINWGLLRNTQPPVSHLLREARLHLCYGHPPTPLSTIGQHELSTERGAVVCWRLL